MTSATIKISTHYQPPVDGLLSRRHASLTRDTATGRYQVTLIFGSVAEGSSWHATQTRAEDHVYALGYTESITEERS